MPELTGPTQSFMSNTDVVDTVQRHTLGTRAWDPNGNEYIYMQGVANVIVGTVVTFDENFVTAEITANAVGRVAVARAIVDAVTEFGWFQIYGESLVTRADATADNTAAYIDGTAGRIDDAVVAGDQVHGMMIRSISAANLCITELNYPYVDDSTET